MMSSEEKESLSAPCAGEPAQKETPAASGGHDAESPSEAEARLNDLEEAQDAAPATRRRMFSVLTVMALLFVALIVVVVAMPPMGGYGTKKKSGNYRMLADVVAVGQSGNASSLAYAPITDEAGYRFELSQASRYDASNATTKTEIAGDLVFVRDGGNDELRVQFSRVEPHVFDGTTPVDLNVGHLLEGVSLYTRIDARQGVGSVLPDADTNPQVGRVLFIVADLLRYVWIPLPGAPHEGALGWTFEDLEKSPASRRGTVVRTARGEDVVLTTDYVMTESGGEDAVTRQGTGRVTVVLRDGDVRSAEGTLTSRPVEKGTVHEVAFKLERVAKP